LLAAKKKAAIITIISEDSYVLTATCTAGSAALCKEMAPTLLAKT